jgi:SOUL heme-binding protein
MLIRLFTFASQLVEGAGSVVGLRFGTEEPHYTSNRTAHGVEIRQYGERIAAETTVFADEETARNMGFRRLAGYIFGRNHDMAKIAMTAPVAQERNQKIAMTAPVSRAPGPDGGSVIRFFMPSKWTMETLPEPDDDAVKLVTVPAETVAVLRFSGDRGKKAVASRTRELLDALQDTAFESDGAPVAWFYDPPWTLPFRRRNEIAVPVTSR